MKEEFKIITGFLPWFLCGILLLPFTWLRKIGRDRRRILFFTQNKIGDFVAQVPLFRETKRYHKDSFITVLLIKPDLEGLIKCDQNVDEIILWDAPAGKAGKIRLILKLMRNNYDCFFNLSFESWVDFISLFSLIPNRITIVSPSLSHTLKLYYKIIGTKLVVYPLGAYSTSVYLNALNFIGVYSSDATRRIYPCLEDKEFASKLIEEYQLRNKKYLIAISVSCGNKLKEWQWEKFAALAEGLLENFQANVVFVGSRADKELVAKVISLMKNPAFDFSGFFNLGQLAAFLEKIDLYICVDSGPLYIANAVGTPVIDIAGPVDTREQLEVSTKAKVVQPNLPCVPCSYVAKTARTCRLGGRDCLEKTQARDVILKAREILF